mmetsp:Transcript_78455/g.254812  ORF Transcript_78455/g.254812 Transcript_78455/m.254812 type:complete len:385 (+) Transcript_78455:403-1557(+)
MCTSRCSAFCKIGMRFSPSALVSLGLVHCGLGTSPVATGLLDFCGWKAPHMRAYQAAIAVRVLPLGILVCLPEGHGGDRSTVARNGPFAQKKVFKISGCFAQAALWRLRLPTSIRSRRTSFLFPILEEMARMLFAFAALVGATVATEQATAPSICGDDPTKVPDCNHPDLGSCGNACCVVEVSLPSAPTEVYSRLKEVLSSGMDGTFEYVTGGDPNPGDDLRPYNISQPKPFQFIVQGRHNAPQYKGEDGDILDFNIAAHGSGSSLRMFSLSRVHGALGDAGQNFKTLSFLLKNTQLAISTDFTIVHGCGKAIGVSTAVSEGAATAELSVIADVPVSTLSFTALASMALGATAAFVTGRSRAARTVRAGGMGEGLLKEEAEVDV